MCLKLLPASPKSLDGVKTGVRCMTVVVVVFIFMAVVIDEIRVEQNDVPGGDLGRSTN